MLNEHFGDRDQLGRVALERMLPRVSTRWYRRTQERVATRPWSTSRSSVSGSFVARTREGLGELIAHEFGDLRIAVMMVDGLDPRRG